MKTYKIYFERSVEAQDKDEALTNLEKDLADENTTIWNELQIDEA